MIGLELAGKDIEFLPGVEDFDCYVETGMRATISEINAYPENGLYELKLNYEKFEDHNRKFESLRYYDDENNRYLTFRELNGYYEEESYCVSVGFDNFRVITENVEFELKNRIN